MNRISFLNRGYAFKGLLAVITKTYPCNIHRSLKFEKMKIFSSKI